MRNTGLSLVTLIEQWRCQVCLEAVGVVKNQANLKLLLLFPRGEEAFPSPLWVKLGDHHENGKHITHWRLREAGERLLVQPMNAISDLKGVHLGREEMGDEHPRRVADHLVRFRQKVYFQLTVARARHWKSHTTSFVCLVRKPLGEIYVGLSVSADTRAMGQRFSPLPPSPPPAVYKTKECKAALLPHHNHLLGGRPLDAPLQLFCPSEAKPICQGRALQSSDVANWNHLILNAKYLFAHKLETTPFLEKPRGNWWLHARIQTSNCVIFICKLALCPEPMWGAEVCSVSQAAPWSLIRNFPGPLLSQLLYFRDELQVISK